MAETMGEESCLVYAEKMEVFMEQPILVGAVLYDPKVSVI
jgi:hypothetical protein